MARLPILSMVVFCCGTGCFSRCTSSSPPQAKPKIRLAHGNRLIYGIVYLFYLSMSPFPTPAQNDQVMDRRRERLSDNWLIILVTTVLSLASIAGGIYAIANNTPA